MYYDKIRGRRALVRFILPLLLLILLLSQVCLAQAEEVSVVVAGQVLSLQEPPLIKDEQVLLPVRPLLEAMGAEVHWEEESQTVVGLSKDYEIVIPVGCAETLVNGEPVLVDIPAVLVEGRTYIPICLLEQSLDSKVELATGSGTIAVTAEPPEEEAKIEKISINTADKELLQTTLGIRSSIAENIIEYRESVGPFWKVEDLLEVAGVDAGLFATLKDKISVVFADQGLASWYGAEFRGRRTASGEIFKPEELTAAHRDLPFGTYVNVKFPPTGKETVVRINDRGPHAPGRLIDLSRGAADAIGLRPYGVAKVKLKIMGEEIS